ncbi:hypothetical protein L6164_026607 [Bauhinia variegata]|uniref:Uncharacterized protein n=1 Tax=Bauhinia variegata TaxID=167791 RepID=A0ACB9LQY5_BAUVA|nr:hypothetical protein L6164_026607 [Bauhinia variegata]
MVSHGHQAAPLLLLAIFFNIYFALPIFAELPNFHYEPKSDQPLNFLVIGDWGRRGLFNQSLVAAEMGKIGDKLDIDFVVSTGDNFYDDGLTGVHDPAFVESFSKVYTARSLHRPWFSVLGNHDYRGDVLAQLSPALQKIDRRWFCLRSYALSAEYADFFFLDTSPFVDHYFKDWDHKYDWRGLSSRKTYLTNLLKDFEEALKKSTANWKIVVGHHPIRSIGRHGDTPELIEQIVPLLKANDVHMYMNGHDHCLEHISSRDGSVQYLTSGAGSKAWRGDIKSSNDEHVKFFFDGQGFMSVQITQTTAEVVFYDVHGDIRHQFELIKPQQLHASV